MRELTNMLEDGIRLRAIGDLSGLPKFAQEIVEETVEKTKFNSEWNLTLALNYGSHEVLKKAFTHTPKIFLYLMSHRRSSIGKHFLLI